MLRRNVFLKMVLTSCLVTFVSSSQGTSSDTPDYLTIVKAYADAMIKDGRDIYGSEHSPLFASALDRTTMRIGALDTIEGVRKDDRSLTGANPQVDKDLYRILYRLTKLTGETHYALEADDALAFFYSHGQSPNTGLMAWGEHLYWDFEKEKVAGEKGVHEMKGVWPFWDQCYSSAPDVCWKFAIGLWDHQIADKQTGDFSRHADWASHGPYRGSDFPRYAGQMIATWSDAYSRKENGTRKRRDELRTAIAVLVSRMEGNISVGGYLLAGTDKTHRQISWPTSNLELARCLWIAAEQQEKKLAQRMRSLALKMDQQFHRVPHTIKSGGGFVTTIDSQTGEPRSREMNKPYSESWASGYGYGVHAEVAMRSLQRYRQLKTTHPGIAAKYKSLILAAADQYLTAEPDSAVLLKPSPFAIVIDLLVSSYHITGEERYLERAEYFGQAGVELFLGDGRPLPKASNAHDHYESITGGPQFMYALLKLHEAKQ